MDDHRAYLDDRSNNNQNSRIHMNTQHHCYHPQLCILFNAYLKEKLLSGSISRTSISRASVSLSSISGTRLSNYSSNWDSNTM
jgi:hypothetical protein